MREKMPQFIARHPAVLVVVLMLIGLPIQSFAADPEPLEGKALIEAQLEEAKRLLEEDKASHLETAEKKRMIDEKLAAQQEREAQIQEELKLLCEEQEKLSPGTLESCMEKTNN